MTPHLVDELIRHLKQEGIGTALYHVRRFLIWQVTTRLPLPILYYLFELNRRIRSDRSDANPLRLIEVSPNEITYIHTGEPNGFGKVASGDWDTNRDCFDESAVYRSLANRFEDGMDWQETELYQRYEQQLEDGEPYWRCTTPEELQEYFDSIDRLYKRITEDGYKSQRELLAEKTHVTRKHNNDALHPALNEISVNIYRDGSLAKTEAGNHRLTIAKLLDLDSIPVVVRARHPKWQAIRDEIRAAESPSELSIQAKCHLTHPDLVDIVPQKWNYSTDSDD